MRSVSTKFLYNICFLFSLSLMAGCISQINYDVSNEKTRIVINSLLTTKSEIQKVYVRKSVLSGNNSTTISIPVTDALVTIKSSTAQHDLIHDGDGVYTTLFAAIPNETYTLEVASNGQTYRSTSQKMPAPHMFLKAKADLISKESLNASGNLVTDKFVNIHLTGNIATDFKSLYRIYGEYEFMEFNPPSTTLKTCYVPENIDNNTIKLLSAKDQRTDLVENFSLMDVPFDARFYRMYAFKIYQYAISGASLSYWKKINQISTTGQNLFDSPPGKIVGNIKNIGDPNDEVLGNFTLGAVSDTIIFTNMVKLGGVVTDICQVRFNTARPAVCLNCLLLPLSTTNRPDYWPQ